MCRLRAYMEVLASQSHCMFIVPEIFRTRGLIALQSTRQGGVSKAPFKSLNLGLLATDREEAVRENRALLCKAIGISPGQLVLGRQVHGDRILTVHQPLQTDGYDAYITNKPGVFLAVFVADCTPVLIYDPVQKACAAIHAGWKGTVSRIVVKTLNRMHLEFGTKAADCLAFIGACISFEAFEVGADVADHFSRDEKRYGPDIHKFFVDLKAANRHQLLNAGLSAENIETSGYCTVRDNGLFFSHRKEKGTTGRMMAVIGIKT
jgi:purine-nucleoside/S-methyl-5'-thioadenosine phosphorylase / adenosine deaminase